MCSGNRNRKPEKKKKEKKKKKKKKNKEKKKKEKERKKSHMGRLETIEQPSNPNTSKMLAPASTNDVGVDRTKIDGSCEKGLAEMEGGAVPATNDDGSSTNVATTPSSQMKAAAAAATPMS